jgi:hypothetical protein
MIAHKHGGAFAWLLLVVLHAGCEATVVVPWSGEAGPALPSEAEFPRRVTDAFCAARSSCCGAAVDGPPCDASVYDDFSAYADSNRHKYIHFDPERASACLDALAALRCDDGAAWAPALELCKHVYVGELAPGEWCTNPRVCSVEGGVNTVCSFQNGCILVKEARLNESCGGWQKCVPDATCSGGKCVALPDPGEPCLDDQCATGAYCAEGTCSVAKPPDAACAGDGECSLGSCVEQRCASICEIFPQ